MNRSTKWKTYELVVGKQNDRCAACHHNVKGETVLRKTSAPTHRSIEVEIRCWRCVSSREGCELFIQLFPDRFKIDHYGPWYKLRIKPPIQPFLANGDRVVALVKGKYRIPTERED